MRSRHDARCCQRTALLYHYQWRPKVKGVRLWPLWYNTKALSYSTVKTALTGCLDFITQIKGADETHVFSLIFLRMTSRLWIPEVGRLCTWLCRWGTWSQSESFWDMVLKWLKKTAWIGQVSYKAGCCDTMNVSFICFVRLCGLFDHLEASSHIICC